MPSSFYCTLRCHFRTRSIIFAYPFYVTVWKEENNKIGWFKKLSFGVLFVGDARVHNVEVPWKDVDFITIWVVSAWHVSSIFAINTEYYATCTVINSILRVFERDMKDTSSFISCADWKPSLLIIFFNHHCAPIQHEMNKSFMMVVAAVGAKKTTYQNHCRSQTYSLFLVFSLLVLFSSLDNEGSFTSHENFVSIVW